MPANMLTYAEDLESAGLTREQAVAIARGVADVLDERFDELVTRTHFDAKMGEVDGRFKHVDERFENVERRLDRLESLVPEVRLHTWMLALLIAALVVPKLQAWFA